jgi:putative ABC transport system substrate-binding protein
MALTGDPIANGLVESLSRPGGNVTGMSGVNAQLGGKCVELIREMLPLAHRVVALTQASNSFSKPFLEQIEAGGSVTGIVIDNKTISSIEDLEAAFADMEKERPDAVIVQPSLPNKRAAELAATYRIPAVSTFQPFAEQGGLMSYAPAMAYLYRRAAVYVDKILKGAKPGDLPVEQPTQFELIINMKTAKALGLIVPPSLLARADKVIE